MGAQYIALFTRVVSHEVPSPAVACKWNSRVTTGNIPRTLCASSLYLNVLQQSIEQIHSAAYTLQIGVRSFHEMLVDGDLTSNVLGWQWACGCNSDSLPISSLINPVCLAKKQDPTGFYVRKWVPELAKLPDKYGSSTRRNADTWAR